jgi:hypothetical protein
LGRINYIQTVQCRGQDRILWQPSLYIPSLSNTAFTSWCSLGTDHTEDTGNNSFSVIVMGRCLAMARVLLTCLVTATVETCYLPAFIRHSTFLPALCFWFSVCMSQYTNIYYKPLQISTYFGHHQVICTYRIPRCWPLIRLPYWDGSVCSRFKTFYQVNSYNCENHQN